MSEDIDQITKYLTSVVKGSGKMTLYHSVYSPVSQHLYPVTAPPQWRNLVDAKMAPLQLSIIDLNKPASSATGLNSDTSDMKLGIPIDERNAVVGPSSSEIGIQSKGSWTIVMQIRFGRLNTGGSSPPLDVMSLFTASHAASSTHGVVLRLSDVDTSSIVQTARVSIVVSNNSPMTCKIGGNDRIPFDTNITYTFTIVKTGGALDVFMTSSVDPDNLISILDVKSIKQPDDFVNLPLVFNNNRNVNARVLAVGAYNTNLPTLDIKAVHEYFSDREKQMRDRHYVEALKMIDELEKRYKEMSVCPFATAAPDVCRSCGVDITNWAQFDQIALATDRCRAAIAQACASGAGGLTTSKGVCACWNKNNLTVYNSPGCENMRAAFEGRKMHDLTRLQKSELNNLCPRCPSTTTTPPRSAPVAAPPKPVTPPQAPMETNDHNHKRKTCKRKKGNNGGGGGAPVVNSRTIRANSTQDVFGAIMSAIGGGGTKNLMK